MRERIATAALVFLAALFAVVVLRALVLFYQRLWHAF